MSLQANDCSWYTACSPDELEPAPADFAYDAFRTAPVSASAAFTASEPRPLVLRPANSSARRDALRHTLANAKLPWFRPRARMRVALGLFGRVGTNRDAASFVKSGGGSGELVRASRASFARHVLTSNPSCTFDVFAHSWSPELGALIDELWRPVWSAHEDDAKGAASQPSGQRASRSIARLLGAKSAHERAVGRTYDLVWVMRHDVAFFAPVPWAGVPRAQLWFPGGCCRRTRLQPEVQFRVSRLCGLGSKEEGSGGDVQGVCRALFIADPSALQRRTSELTAEGDAMVVNDWMFAAPSPTADTFSSLHSDFESYRAVLREVWPPPAQTGPGPSPANPSAAHMNAQPRPHRWVCARTGCTTCGRRMRSHSARRPAFAPPSK